MSIKTIFSRRIIDILQLTRRKRLQISDSSIKIGSRVACSNPRNLIIGRNVRLGNYVRLNGKITIGNETHIRNHVRLKGEIVLGNESHIGDYVRLIGNIKIGNESHIRSFAYLNSMGGCIVMGDYCSVNDYCVIYGMGNVIIENNVRIATHTVIVSGNHTYENLELPIRLQPVRLENINIQEDVWIGANCLILAGVTIGKGSVIGAGSLVNKDIPPYSIAVGVPAKKIKERGS